MDNRPVFVLVTSSDCPHCSNFRTSLWDEVRDSLTNSGTVRVVDIEVPKMGAPIPSNYPSDLKRFVKWYPTFILVNGKSWNDGKKLSASVFNGIMRGDVPEYDRLNAKGPTKENLLVWIQTESTSKFAPSISESRGGGGLVSKEVKYHIPASCSKLKYRPKNS